MQEESNAFNQRPDGALIMPSYAIVGAHLHYDFKRFRLGLKANNIADEKILDGMEQLYPTDEETIDRNHRS